MRTTLLLAGLSMLLYLAGLSLAEGCVPSTSHPEVDTGAAGLGPRLYVDNDVCQPDGCFFSVWIYEEANGIDGLQRGDEVVDDTCGGAIEGDAFPI